MLRFFRRIRVLFVSLLIIFVGTYTFISKWYLLQNLIARITKGQLENKSREFIEDFLPQAKATEHERAFCPPWKLNDFPPNWHSHHDDGPSHASASWSGLRETTSPFYSTVHLMDRRSQYHLCDKIKAKIELRNWRNQTKRYGGDFLRAVITSKDSRASSNADHLIDHGNGTYVAFFTLRWPAEDAKIEVTLIHPREAVDTLRKIQRLIPNRFAYTGRFNEKGNVSRGENKLCHVYRPENPSCNLSDTTIHAPWFCERPSKFNLTCADFTWHRANNVLSNEEAGNLVTENEGWLFYLQKKLITSYNDTFTVTNDAIASLPGSPQQFVLPYCTTGSVPRTLNTAGYFFNETWFPQNCEVHPFTVTEALTCLRNKTVYFYGDSTVRQLYEFFVNRCWKTFQTKHVRTSKFWKVGPLKARDDVHNITLNYQHHGLPIRNNWTWVKDIRYVSKELDTLMGGSDVIVVISLWAHFTATSYGLFEQRLRDIKYAIKELKNRSPQTTVIVKGANTRDHSGLSYALYASDWFAQHLEQILRNAFAEDENIGYLDVWDMTSAHHYKDAIHPPEEVVANVVNRMLTYICKVN